MPGLFQVRFCISSPVFPCILIRNAQNSVCTLISSSFYPCICPENVDVAEQSVHLNCNTFHCKFALYLICSKSYWLKNKYKIRHWPLIKPDNCGVDYKCTRAEHLLKFLLNYIEIYGSGYCLSYYLRTSSSHSFGGLSVWNRCHHRFPGEGSMNERRRICRWFCLNYSSSGKDRA